MSLLLQSHSELLNASEFLTEAKSCSAAEMHTVLASSLHDHVADCHALLHAHVGDCAASELHGLVGTTCIPEVFNAEQAETSTLMQKGSSPKIMHCGPFYQHALLADLVDDLFVRVFWAR